MAFEFNNPLLYELREDLISKQDLCVISDTGKIVLDELPSEFYGITAVLVGTAQAGALSTITLTSSASIVDDRYNNFTIAITSGTGSGQSKLITDYVGSTKVATISGTWAISPNNTSVYSIACYNESKIITGLSINSFYVNYLNSIITFNSSEIGQTVLASYQGRGIIQMPAERVYSTDGNDVTQTLQNMIDTGSVAIEALGGLTAAVSTAQALETELDLDVATGNILKSDLDSRFITADTKKTALDLSISNSTTSKINLDASISTSGASKTALDSSNTTANITKSNLDGSNTTALGTKTALDLSNTTAGITKNNLDGSISSATIINGTLDGTISTANISIGELNATNVTAQANESTRISQEDTRQSQEENRQNTYSSGHINFKGVVTEKTSLPASDNILGDTYQVIDDAITANNAMWRYNGTIFEKSYVLDLTFAGGYGGNNSQVFTATANQTLFTLTEFPYLIGVNQLMVYVTGIKQIIGTNYTETSTNSFTLTSGVVAGTKVEAFRSVPGGAGSLTTQEVENARVSSLGVGYANLKARIDAHDFEKVGDLSDLPTVAKTDIVSSINEFYDDIEEYKVENVKQYLNVKNFGAIGDGSSHPLSAFFATLELAQVKYPFASSLTQQIDWAGCQLALDSLAIVGVLTKRVYIPQGIYQFSGSTLIQPANSFIFGDGQTTILTVNQDVSIVMSDRILSTNIQGLGIRDIKLHDARTMTALGSATPVTRTTFQLRYTNATRPIIDNVEISTNVADETNPNTENLGGLWLEVYGSPTAAFMGEIGRIFIRFGGIVIDTTDTKINSGWIWGHTTKYALWMNNNNIRAVNVDITPSPVTGGVYALTTVRNCYWQGFMDGVVNTGVVTGVGVYGRFTNCVFEGHIWRCSKEGFYLISGEANTARVAFRNCNRANNSHPDILLKPSASGEVCRNNSFIGCTHDNDLTTTNKAPIFKEDDANSVGNVKLNIYMGNTKSLVSNGYSTPNIQSIRTMASYERTVIGPNTGMNTQISGVQAFASDATTQTVTHNLGTIPFPHEINISPSNLKASQKAWYLANITTTTFDIIIDTGDATGTAQFNWGVKLSN